MSRIRTVKPQFWTDGKIKRLSDPCALFFIALWNFSDDYGYFNMDTLELSLATSRWRSQSVFGMLCSLSRHGLVRLCSPLGVGLVVGWEHQRISDRRASKWNGTLIKWDDINIDAQGSDRIRPVLDRKGKDRKGTLRGETALEVPLPLTGKTEEPKEQLALTPQGPSDLEPSAQTPVNIFIGKYVEAFQRKFGDKARPVLTGKTQGQIKALVNMFPLEQAVNLIQVYFQMDDKWFQTKSYDFTTFVENIEKVSVALQTGVSEQKFEKQKSAEVVQLEKEWEESLRIRDEQERLDQEQCNNSN